MGKLDELMRSAGAHADESMGKGTIFGAGPLAANAPAPSTPARLQGLVKVKNVAEVPRDRIAPDPDQPREEFDPDSIARLAESLKATGQLQPIRVAWREEQGRYTIIAGERRWRAAEVAGMPTVACIIHDGLPSPAELLVMQIIENLQREDLRPLEQAKAFRRLMEINGWSARQLARELSLTQSSVARALALLDLPGPVQDLVEQGTLPAATACEVSRLEQPEDQVEIATQIVSERLTRDEAAEAIRARKAGSPVTAAKTVRHEFRLKDGRKVIVGGLSEGYGPDDLLAALREATKQAQAASRDARRGEAA
jgi:ParB family chromosome partitioning protein